ncbi:hypothetical protein EDB85DRAFT_2137770 [Lactarius pseudohatsudake]|nr:hypothetical protein EDB85DRAFT_2137770 [Lactarius pseudohatsudake]
MSCSQKNKVITFTLTNICGPKKVMLMGNQTFDNLLTSIKARIGTLNGTVTSLEEDVVSYREEAQAGNQQVASDLAVTKADIDRKKVAIEELKTFFAKMKEEWSELNDCIIGYDVCAIKLDKRRFDKNFMGNVIDLGPEIDSGNFTRWMYPHDDAQSEFHYPKDRLFRLSAILSAAEICKPNRLDHNSDPVHYVIK